MKKSSKPEVSHEEIIPTKANQIDILEHISDAFISLDKNSCFTYFNKRACQLFHADQFNIIGKNCWLEYPELVDTPLYITYSEAVQTRENRSLKRYSDLFSFWYECFFYPSPEGISIFIRDVTEIKKTEDEIKHINRLYLFVSQVNQLIIRTTDQFSFFKEFCRIAIDTGHFQMTWIGKLDLITKDIIPIAFYGEENGYLSKIKLNVDESKVEGNGPTSIAILTGNHYICNDIENDPVIATWKNDALIRNYRSSISIPIKYFGNCYGAIMFYSPIKNYFDEEEVKLLLEVTDNISFKLENIEKERLRIFSSLQLSESEERHRTIVETSIDGIRTIDENGDTTFVNQQLANILGYTMEELMDKNILDCIENESKVHVQLELNKRKDGISNVFEAKMRKKNGQVIWTQISASPIFKNNKYKGALAIIRDITESKSVEEKIKYTNRLYLFISHINQLIIRSKDQQTLFKEFCRIAVEIGGFKMAWIGLLDEQSNRIIPVMHAGDDKGYLGIIKNISANGNELEGRGPTGIAVREARSIFFNDVKIGFKVPAWQYEATKREFLSVMAIPLMKFGKVIGAFTFYAPVENFFDESEENLIKDVTNNVSFALEVYEKEINKKIAEEKLIKSEKNYEALAEMSPVGVFHTDKNGSATYVNPKWCQITGIALNDALGDRWKQSVYYGDKEILFQRWEEALSLGKDFVAEFRFIHSDESISWVVAQLIPKMDDGNKFSGYIGTITDITQRKESEEALKESEEKFRGLSKATFEAIFIAVKGICIEQNQSAAMMFGYTDEEVFGKYGTEWYAPESRKLVEKNMLSGYTEPYEAVALRKDGSTFPCMIKGKMINYKGKEVRVISLTDITERKEVEQQYSDLFNLSPQPMFLYDLETLKFIRVNQAAILSYGYSIEEFLQMSILDIRPKSEILKTKDYIEKHKDELDIKRTTQFIHQKKSGETFDVEIFSTTFISNKKRIGSAIAIDISEKKLHEIELNKAILKTQEDERYEIGGELHDNIE